MSPSVFLPLRLFVLQAWLRSLSSTPVMQAQALCLSTSTVHPRLRWTVGSVPKATKSPTHQWHLATISSPSNTAGRSTSWAALSKLKSQVGFTVVLPSDLWITDDKCLTRGTNVLLSKVWKSGEFWVIWVYTAQCTFPVETAFSSPCSDKYWRLAASKLYFTNLLCSPEMHRKVYLYFSVSWDTTTVHSWHFFCREQFSHWKSQWLQCSSGE